MGLDWLLTPKPRAGCEEEWQRLREVEEELGGWGAESPEEVEAMRRLKEISVRPRETWEAFLAEPWEQARAALEERPEMPLEEWDRRLLGHPSLGEAMRLLRARFPASGYQRYDHLNLLLGDPRLRLARWTTRELNLLYNGWYEGSVWRHFNWAPGVWDRVDGQVDRDSTAAECLRSARLLRETVCGELRRIVPSLAGRGDAEIEADFDRWAEHRWRAREGVLDACPIAPPPWLPELDAVEAAAEEARRNGSFEYGRTPTREMVEHGIHAFAVARWLEFWGSRGHGFIRSA